MKIVLLLASIGLLSLGCALTDSKDATCPAEEMYQSEAGDRYCLDEAAPAECDHVVDEILDAFVLCSDGAFTEAELRAEIEAQGIDFPCDDAVATSNELDTCYEQLADPECEDSLPVISSECEGSVLAKE